MAATALSREEFGTRLALRCSDAGRAVDDEVVDQLYRHYSELLRWSRRLNLVSRADLESVVERHYADSLSGLALVPSGLERALDIGSGAGFPGLVLAAALPDVTFFVVEARQRKWAFLRSAARICAENAVCLHGKVSRSLPEGVPREIDLVTVRGLQLPMPAWESLHRRLSPAGRILVWTGQEEPEVPGSLDRLGELRDAAAESRRIVAYARAS